jgi:hypothetical protein
VTASGTWYWFVDRLEHAGQDVRIVNPLETKKRMAGLTGVIFGSSATNMVVFLKSKSY